jgi:23S rRNA-/tRNA-specific pseudouridylate synthase
VSPSYLAASKDVELRRAMTSSTRSAVIASADVVFEDEWLAVIDKPAGVYCDALLTSFPCPAVSGKKRLNLKRICF